jgi:hypothetical protein
VVGSSSFEAAWNALQRHEGLHGRQDEEDVRHIAVEGKDAILWDYKEHNEMISR